MERSGHLNTAEVVGVAMASAAALGGIIVALGRAQQHGQRDRLASFERLTHDSAVAPARAALHRAADLAGQFPAFRDTATDALHRAGAHVRPAADAVTGIATARVVDVRSASADAVEKLRETIAPAAAGAISALTEQVAHVRERGEESGTGLIETSSHAAEIAVTKTRTAIGELSATILWFIVATTLAYVAMLDEERRRRLKAFLGQTIEQIQLLRSDFAGYEDEL